MSEKKVDRRTYLKYSGAAIGGLIVGGALGYLAKPAEVVKETVTVPGAEKTVEKTIERTVTAPVEKPGRGIRFDYLSETSGADPVFAAWSQGAKDFCEPMGIDIVFRFGEGDVVKTAKWIDEAVAAGTNGIVFVGFYPETYDPPIKRAVEAGVPVIVSIVDTAGPSRTCFVGVGDLVKLGREKAKPLTPYLTDGCWVLSVMEELATRALTYEKSAVEYWKEQGLKINVETLEATNDLTTAESRIVAKLTANPGKYKAILAHGGITTAASNLAERDVGLKPGEVPITGLDFLDPTIKGIRDGYTLGVISWQPHSSGYIPAAILYPYVKWGLAMPDYVWTGITFVTREMLDKFLKYVEQHRW